MNSTRDSLWYLTENQPSLNDDDDDDDDVFVVVVVLYRRSFTPQA